MLARPLNFRAGREFQTTIFSGVHTPIMLERSSICNVS
jgi:hypothetical protein